MPKLSIIVPFYCNEDNIPAMVIANEVNFLAGLELAYMFIDDGLGDGMVPALHQMWGQYPSRIRVTNVDSCNTMVARIGYTIDNWMAIITANMQSPPPVDGADVRLLVQRPQARKC